MAVPAAHILVGAAQRELRSLLMVEKRRFPFCAAVALRAAGNVGFCELLAVDVFMAVFALGRGGFEIHVDQSGFEIRRFVAVHASGGAMRSKQREFRLRVIEAGEFFPRLGCVASFASGDRSVGTDCQHPFLELAFVRICMATGTVQASPAIDHGRLRLKSS